MHQTSPVTVAKIMHTVPPSQNHSDHSRIYLALAGIFLAWKCILLAVVLVTPADGSGYDTSADLFFLLGSSSQSITTLDAPQYASQSANNVSNTITQLPNVARIVTKLTRWDALYYVSAALKGYVHEQEWAFSFGYTALVKRSSQDDATNVVLHGVVITNACHFLASIVLYRLAYVLSPATTSRKRNAYIAAILHIISPAGVFMIAPYSEAPFALLTFLGCYFYARAIHERSHEHQNAASNVYIVASGAVFGLAATFRSNGLLNGTIFACDALLILIPAAFKLPNVAWSSSKLLPSMWATVLAGVAVGTGFVYPQVVAYREYCMNELPSAQAPPWCSAVPPSIYTYIQAYYWNVGFMKYWTISNIPLFLLAAPMLIVLFYTGKKTIQQAAHHVGPTTPAGSIVSDFVLFRLALPQILVAVLTLTTAHVQIVNRLSTGYPVWYMVLASAIVFDDQKHRKWSKVAVQLMVTYAIVQAALFSAFLPPA